MPEHLVKLTVPLLPEKGVCTTVKVVGMVTTCQIETIGSQALSASMHMGAVHRLNVGGCGQRPCLRYSRSLPRGSLREEVLRN